jgi:hypothetical protein
MLFRVTVVTGLLLCVDWVGVQSQKDAQFGAMAGVAHVQLSNSAS